jgi:rubrerythrin
MDTTSAQGGLTMAENLDADLARAFAYMSKSSVLTRLCAAKLKQEGRTAHSKLLRAIARAEEIHARRTLMYIRGRIGDTAQYLNKMLECKYRDTTQKYPQISEQLNETGKKKAAEAFGQFGEVAKVHLKFLKEVFGHGAYDSTNYYVCMICGNIAIYKPYLKCSVCNAVPEKFKLED